MATTAEFPKDFRDPLYASLDLATEKKLSLPPGLLSSIRLHGEKSNADQVSEAQARSPYQFIPSTRKAIISKYGIDPLLSPQNASEVAGLLLKEGLDRNGGDPVLAAAEYHAGPNRAAWGPRTRAYMARVADGMSQAKGDALADGFAAFMKANPAVPAAAPAASAPPSAPAPAAGSLDAAFGQFLASQERRSNTIPGAEGASPIPADPSIGDRLIGAGEAGLNLLTGATGGTVGMVRGALGGIVQSVRDGTFGTQEGVRLAEQSAMEQAGNLTYQPRTEQGQAQAGMVATALSNALPIAPLAGETAALQRAATLARPGTTSLPSAVRSAAAPAADVMAPAVAPAVAAVAPAVQRVQQAVQGIPGRVAQVMGREAEGTPTPGTPGSVGAAGVDMALQRRMAARELPEPIELTSGQATRDFAQQRFERETAKNPEIGAPLRERMAEQNQAVLRNMDNFFDRTGATAPDLRTAGIAVDRALVEQAARDKARVRVAYKNAEKAGEMEAPVVLDSVIRHLNESAPEAATAPLLTTARAKAIQTGIATVDDAGNLVARAAPLRTVENFRQSVGNATDYTPTNVRQATIIKQLVDEATDGLGGDLYKAARAQRARYAQNYESRANIASLLDTKRGTADRAVAFEDVFNHSILKGSLDDVRNMRRVLQRGGDEGAQAWRELQGQTVAYIREQAAKNISRDERGNVVVSPAGLDRAIKSLDADGKLDFIFGKKGAEQMRILNDVAKHIYTSPPGAVNTSNTASVLLAALDMAISGAGGMPLPITSGLRLVVNNVKDRRLRLRVESALRGESTATKSTPKAPRKKTTLH